MTARLDSAANPRIVAAIKAVEAHEKMLLEGARMIEEALDAGVLVEEMFVSDIPRMSGVKGALRAPHSGHGPLTPDIRERDSFYRRLHQQPPHIRKTLITEVSARVLRKLSALPSSRGVVAIAAPPHHTLASFSSLSSLSSYSPSKKTVSSNLPRRDTHAVLRGSETEGPLFLLLDDVQDPTNVGAILRSGEAFGVSAALLTPGCAWPFSARALRASAGSAFRLPVAAGVARGEALTWAHRNGIALAGAAAHGGTVPEALSGARPLALVIGSEGHGISAEIGKALDHRVTLPLAGRVDSLNAAVAAGVLLHILTSPRPHSL